VNTTAAVRDFWRHSTDVKFSDVVALLVTLGNDEFDSSECLHAYLSSNHGGQWTDAYRLLCESPFRPGPMWSESEVERRLLATWSDCENIFKRG